MSAGNDIPKDRRPSAHSIAVCEIKFQGNTLTDVIKLANATRIESVSSENNYFQNGFALMHLYHKPIITSCKITLL